MQLFVLLEINLHVFADTCNFLQHFYIFPKKFYTCTALTDFTNQSLSLRIWEL